MTILDLQNHAAEVSLSAFHQNTAVAVGNFDGVHIGHQALLADAVHLASEHGLVPAVWTFHPHPFIDTCKQLSLWEDKLALMRYAGIRYVFWESFEAVRDNLPEQFSKEILCGACHAKAVVCGFNFHYGKAGSGTPDALAKSLAAHGAFLSCVDPIILNGAVVSSTRIRACLEAGKIEEASALLGRPYSAAGTVLHGKALGRTIGIPTINQMFSKTVQLPALGTYASAVRLGGKMYPAVTNVGIRPSIAENDTHQINAETHIIGYDGWLYDAPVRVYFRFRLRDEKEFPNLEALKAQIAKDIERSSAAFDPAFCPSDGLA